MTLDESAARYLTTLLERTTGQKLAPSRSWRIETVLGPLMRDRGLDSLAALVTRIADKRDATLLDDVIDQLLNHETSFFRDAPLFQAIDTGALGVLREARGERRRLRIWCAGCSTGQEVYSLAMMIGASDPRWTGWTIDILGTDVSAPAVRRAQAGIYTGFEIQRGLPITQMLRWFDPDRDDWRVKVELAKRVRFAVHNILDPPPSAERFDLVLCRNVLFYLTPERRTKAFAQIAVGLAPDGFLMLGAGETVAGRTDAFAACDASKGLFRRISTPTRKLRAA